jgi:ribonuclease HI
MDRPAPVPEHWTIHVDGTALPGGDVGVGAVLVSPDGARHTISRTAGRPGHGKGCSNEAEASALIAALEAARSLGARSLSISSDSSVVVTEATVGPRTRVEPLATLCAEARRLLAGFDAADVRWVSRRKNTEADALARAALGLAPKPLPPHPRRRG